MMARDLQEVVERPAAITIVPLSPPYLVGAFNLRGTVMPVVDLRVILAVAPAGERSDEKIVIVRHEEVTIGLLVDGVSDVLRVRDEELRHFTYAAGPYPEIVRHAIMRDTRIVHVLDLSAVLQVQSMPRISQNRPAREGPTRLGARGWTQYVSFLCAGISCALDARAIREIINAPTLETSVLAGGLCRGVVKLRGTVVPVVDFEAVLGLPGSEDGPGQLIIMDIGGSPIGFRISRVVSIVKRREDEVMGLPLFGLARPGFYAGVISDAGTDVLLLDHGQILSEGEIRTITQGHSDIYNAGEAKADGRSGESAPRTAHLVFRADALYAVPLSSVQEIIKAPDTFTPLGGAGQALIGVHHLRDMMISLVDFRAIRGGGPEGARSPDARVLVVRGERDVFGFLVDSVESIEMLSLSARDKLPAIWQSTARTPLDEYTNGVVQLELGGRQAAVTFLDLGGVAAALGRGAAVVRAPEPVAPEAGEAGAAGEAEADDLWATVARMQAHEDKQAVAA